MIFKNEVLAPKDIGRCLQNYFMP